MPGLDTQVPNWLVDEIRWRRTIGDEGTRMVNNMVNIGGALLQQKGQREALALQADEQRRMHEDMEQLPVWLQQHEGDPKGYVPKSRWGQVTSAQAWNQKYQQGIVDARKTAAEATLEWRKGQAQNQSVEAKQGLKVWDQFTKDLSAIPTNSDTAPEKAAILAAPRHQQGFPTEDQFRRLGDLQKKYPKIDKAQSPVGKLEADRQAAINAGAPPEVISAYDDAIKKQAPKASGEPMTKTLADGTTLAWMPGANTLHVLKGGKSVELTPSQALKLAGSEGLSDEDKRLFNEYAASKGKSMTGGFKPSEKPKESSKPGLIDRIKGWFSSGTPATTPATTGTGTTTAPASTGSAHDEEADIAARPAPSAAPAFSVDDFNKWLKERQSQP